MPVTISLTQPASQNTPVAFSLGGSAASSDYSLAASGGSLGWSPGSTTGTVTIPTGSSQATVTIQAMDIPSFNKEVDFNLRCDWWRPVLQRRRESSVGGRDVVRWRSSPAAAVDVAAGQGHALRTPAQCDPGADRTIEPEPAGALCGWAARLPPVTSR